MVPKTSIHRKLELARQELLDLGLRNPLLNYRTLKARGLDIVQEKPEDLYRLMVEEKRKLTFLAASEVKPANVESDEITADALAMEFVETEHLGQQDQQYTAALDLQQREGYTSGTRLQTNYSDKQLETRLLGTYHAARTHIEEQGVNVLYLALGMLHWHETEISAEERKAPLVLIPVQLARVSARERFTIAYTDDELGHNLSLAAKLKTDFAIELPELPEEEGLDVQAYFSAVKQAVSGQQRWKVDIEAISVGFFSFGKFLMYRDLDAANWPENSSPEGHPIISALLEDGFREQPSLIGDDEPIDRYFKLMEAHHIMDADSSQIMAILDANQGRNMVIQGPPGTGKSQTITNLIAEAIGAGKKVLFVSEKMAALEVVKRRLDAAGLGVACLELHSHKTNKKTLLSELAATLDLGKPNYQEDGNLTLLEDLRTRLNDYSNAINTPVGQSRVTPYQALGRLAEYQLANKDITLPKVLMPNMETWTAEQFTKRQALVEELQKLMESMGLPALHPFWGSGIKVVLPFEIETLRQQVLAADENLQALLDSCREYTLKLGNPPVKDAAELSVYIQLLDRTVQAPDLKGVLADSDKWVREAGTLDKLGEAGLAYSRIHEQYDAHLLPEAWEHDWIEERQALVTYQGKWWRFLSGTYRKARNKVLGLCRNLKDTGSLLPLLDAVIDARHHEVFIGAHETLVRDLFREDWKGAFSNWEKIAATSKWMTALHQEIIAGSLPHWMLELLRSSQSPDGLALERLRVASAGLSRSLTEVRRQIDSLEEALEFNMSKRMEDSSKLIQLDFFMLAELLNLWKDRTSSLQQLASYNNLAQLCRVEELDPFLRLMEQYTGEDPPHLVDCFRWNWYQALASRAFLERDVLPQFEGNRHEHAIVKFRELDRKLVELNRFKLADEHWSKLPRHEAGGQLGVLRREFEKKTRHLPIRQLMVKAGHAIQAIKPVFMMGPLSIAAYIQPGSLEFDLAIFDEASQVKPVDAFGAIIRAKQVIVVGDSKQMPPSNFFDSLAKEEEGDEDSFIADIESILGLFVGQNAPQRMLKWHYRSRHESLITVSNHEFYDNKLVVFPSPDASKSHSGLIYNYLSDTHYDRGRTRTNRMEAKAIAAAVLQHARFHPELTLGVAAFSMAQMQAVLDEIEIMRRSNPICESFFSAHPHEPFFVKNLENVQGDERDVILISIGYGRTSEGYLAMDFGALNREGGERRLNVLITRARLRCEVFTNLKSDDIDLNRTGARGVKALKTFLKYAELGILDVPMETGAAMDSPFEEAVCRSLIEHGHEVKTQIGSAGFFIDLAIVDPLVPGRFLLGIECDGAAYHSARSARDRDRLRQEILEGLGWTIHRIWSTDWFRHPDRELKRVIQAIEQAKFAAAAPDTEKTARETQGNYEISRDEAKEQASVSGLAKYKAAELSIELAGQEFHMVPVATVASWIAQVVAVESPVHIQETMKRISEALGIKRVGSRMQDIFEKSCFIAANVDRRGDFLWLRDMDTPVIRSRSEMKTGKKPEWLCDEEITEAVMKVARDSFGIEQDKAIPQAYQLLGFSRATEEMKARCHEIIEALLGKGELALKGSILVTD